jgi:hypothetical protein
MEDSIIDEVSPRRKAKMGRRALVSVPNKMWVGLNIRPQSKFKKSIYGTDSFLARKKQWFQGDVSNKSSKNVSFLDGQKVTAMAAIEKQSLRRSRRLSSLECTQDDPQPINETKTALSPVSLRNPGSKRVQALGIQATTHNDDKTLSNATKEGVTKNTKLPSEMAIIAEETATNANRNACRPEKGINNEGFNIESVLLEPRPKRKRLTATTKSTKKRKKVTRSIGGEQESVEHVGLKTTKLDAQSSVLAKSIADSIPTTARCPDLFVSTDDDHCLLRKLEGPFDSSKFTTGIAKFDKASEGNVGEVPAYVTDIFQRLFDSEVRASYRRNGCSNDHILWSP